ncbi:MAG: trehalase family glycosidase [Patescibacteria group bacterium]|jgi:alpha,alpha-trehalase
MNHPYQSCIEYINNYWPQLISNIQTDRGIFIGLPHPFVTPSNKIFQNDQFYWDSYFIILGLVTNPKYINVAKNMVDNLCHLFDRFHIIPERNRFYNTGTSQPPLLTSMVWEIFNLTNDNIWLKTVANIATREYFDYWMYNGTDKQEAVIHNVYQGLSRYCDHYLTHLTAEHESGWDMTSRFNNECLNYLPIDLNCLLYKYEIDLAKTYHLLGEQKMAVYFTQAAVQRQLTINELMWDNKQNFFFDYNYYTKQLSAFWSLAGFYPLWAKLATPIQAETMRKHIIKFEHVGGLATTIPNTNSAYKQWDYPNGWANQQWIVIKGLMNYGYQADAKRLAKKWLDLNTSIFQTTGKFWEAYNVVDQTIAHDERYPRQSGFGWTNGVFLRLVQEFYN